MRRTCLKTTDLDDSSPRGRYGLVKDIASIQRNKAQNSSAVFDASMRTMLPPSPIDLVARQFQSELYARAKTQNVIAVVGTGCGKTFIATLLIRDAINTELQARAQGQKETKLGFFIVDKVALAEQQHTFLIRTCPGRIGLLVGDLEVDNYTEAQWHECYASWDFIVLTADILKDCFGRGFLHMQRISLLVYDECHHAKNNHAYAVIQRMYHQTNIYMRPRVFGLTASPVNSKKDPERGIANLEALMDAKICTPSMDSDLSQFINRAIEEILLYRNSPRSDAAPIYADIHEALSGLPALKKLKNNANHVASSLGEWARICAYKLFLRDAIWKIKARSRLHGAKNADEYEHRIGRAKDLIAGLPELKCDDDIIKLSDKAQRLVNLIEGIFSDANAQPETPVVIVFTERRLTAYALLLLFGQYVKHKLDPVIKPSLLVGHGMNDDGDIQMPITRQNRVIGAFRTGDVNLLFATSIAEEGLDIPACNVVVRFDPLTTAIQYVQSRGRARKMPSKYICMLPVDDATTIARHHAVVELEGAIKEAIAALPEDRFLSRPDQDDVDPARAQIASRSSFEGQLADFLAIPVVEIYCRSLPSDDFVSNRPRYELDTIGAGFQAKCILPPAAGLLPCQGTVQRSKRLAKIECARTICHHLRSQNLLDEHWGPAWDASDPDNHDARDEVDLTTLARSWAIRDANFWKPSDILPKALYMIRLTTNRSGQHSDLLLLTRKPLPQLPSLEFFSGLEDFCIKAQNTGKIVTMKGDELTRLAKFTQLLWRIMVNKVFTADISQFPYFLAFESAARIDWSRMEETNMDDFRDITDHDLESSTNDLLLKDLSRNALVYCLGEASELKSRSPIPSDDMRNRPDQQETIESIALKIKADLIDRKATCRQAVLKTRPISRTLNYLQRQDRKANVVKLRYLLAHHCQVVAVQASLLRMCILMPSFLVRLESYLLAHELNEKLRLSLPLPFIVEAITMPQAGHGQHYERLEFIGDAALKLFSSLAVYVHHPNHHEGLLTMNRTKILCNDNLVQLAQSIKLHEYCRAAPFSRSTWRPANMRIDGEREIPILLQRIARKQHADVVEALLGVAFLEEGLDGSLALANAIGINTFGITSLNIARTTYLGREPSFLFNNISVHNLEEVSQAFKYKFSKPRYVEQALRHGSCYVDAHNPVPSFQRLELLGDAALEVVVASYLYHTFPQYDPDRMTTMKSYLVRNKALGRVSEELGLHKYMRHFNAAVQSAILDYSEMLDALRQQKSKRDWYLDCEPPKFMSDLLESVIGAIYLDNGFDTSPIKEFFHAEILSRLDPDIEYSKQKPLMLILSQVIGKQKCEECQLKIQQHCEKPTLSQAIIYKNMMPKYSFRLTLDIHGNDFITVEHSSRKIAHVNLARAALQKLGMAEDDLDGARCAENMAKLCTCIRPGKTTSEDDDEDEIFLP